MAEKIPIALILAVFIVVSFAFSQSDPSLVWKAQWIWQEADGPANTWMCFRKSFELSQVPASAALHMAVDSKYWLYVNDTLVVFEGGLNRGPTPGAGYFDSLDIQSFLQSGQNTIAVLVWYWGNEGRNSKDSGKGGLLCQLDLEGDLVTSDRSWKTKVHPAYGSVPFEPNTEGSLYLYGGWNIGFDARQDIPDWFRCEFDDSSWNNATEKGLPPCPPWNALQPRPIPQWKDSGLKHYNNATSLPTLSDGRSIIAKLPYNAQVTPYLKIAAPAGLVIKMQTDHYHVNGFFGQRCQYITKEGVQAYEALAWQNGEKVIYEIPAGVRIIDLKYRETGYAAEVAGRFSCDDNFFNSLCQKAARTLYVCLRDNYMDCPDRERGQWIGDVAAEVPQTFYALARTVDQLTKKCIWEFFDWRDGRILQGLVPGAHPGELASQSLNAISNLGIIMTYYRHTGDPAPILHAYDAVKEYLDLWTLNADGTINSRSWWNGQGINIDHTLIETTWYYLALQSAKTMAELTGHSGDASVFQERMTAIAANFDLNFWHNDAYRSASFADDRANGLVVLSGLATREKWPALAAVFAKIKNAEPYMEGYVLEAMFKMGYADLALARMKERYTPMVHANTSTLWEMFTPAGTLNHAWSGAPMTALFRYVAGIEPITPGYAVFSVLPQLGPLNSVNAVVPSIKGEISVTINRDESHYVMDLKSPDSTVAIVGIPKNAFSGEPINAIAADNAVIWKRGWYSGGTAAISWYGEDDDYYKFRIMPGWHKITASIAPLPVRAKGPSYVRFKASQFPNPFNSRTVITIQLPEPQSVSVAVYDVGGALVCRLLEETAARAEWQVEWRGTNARGTAVASGLYFCRIVCGRQTHLMKMVLAR